jgi:hypothetical protein
MTFYYRASKPDELIVKVTFPTTEEAEQFLTNAFDEYQWERVDESQLPKGIVFRQRWPGVAVGVLPERRKRPR